jgi:hypothetical protein
MFWFILLHLVMVRHGRMKKIIFMKYLWLSQLHHSMDR